MSLGQMKKRASLVVGALLLTSCGKPVTQSECDQLLQRYTEKVIDQARPSTNQAERLELIAKTRQAAKIDPAFATCTQQVSRTEFECAMAANNADEIERCLL